MENTNYKMKAIVETNKGASKKSEVLKVRFSGLK